MRSKHARRDRTRLCLPDLLQSWKECMAKGRKAQNQGRWNIALRCYADALDYAEMGMLAYAERRSDRYIRCAFEYVYALRSSGQATRCEGVLLRVRKNLNMSGVEPTQINKLTSPIVDLSKAPMTMVHQWMSTVRAIEESQDATRH